MRVTSSSNTHTSTQHRLGSSDSFPSDKVRASSMSTNFRRRCRLLSKATLAESPSASGHSEPMRVATSTRIPPKAISTFKRSNGLFCTLRLKTIGCPSRISVN